MFSTVHNEVLNTLNIFGRVTHFKEGSTSLKFYLSKIGWGNEGLFAFVIALFNHPGRFW